jgi:MarR family transcriptional regulator, organic hydroperoxide resistance regulator
MNSSSVEQFEVAYRRIWAALNRPDEPDLSQHERQLLHHIPERGGVALTWLARHLLLPKSSASVLIKGLERRGFVTRRRDSADERRLAIGLTAKGRKRVAEDSVLEPDKLARALDRMAETKRRALINGMEELADRAAEVEHAGVSAR